MVEFVEFDIDVADINIPGVDAELGSRLYDYEMDIYLDVLQAFADSISGTIEKPRSVSEESLGNYANAVHGLGGSCASIGAEEMKNKTIEVEQKIKAGDFSGVLTLNDELINDAEKLVSDIQAWLTRLISQ